MKNNKLIYKNIGKIGNWINGKNVTPKTDYYSSVFSPYTGMEIAEVPFSNSNDVDDAVAAAKEAYKTWNQTNIKNRVQVMFRLKILLEGNIESLSSLAAAESGKTPAEAKAGIQKGIEVIEYACSMPNIISGNTQEVSNGIDCGFTCESLGVVSSIVPFNFPFMVPLWTIPLALTAGNTMILKSSEQVPLSAMKFAELIQEAGLPDGVLNIVNGGREAVEAICDHPDVKAISFVGSTKIAKAVYIRGSSNGKRVLALGGAKNHAIVLPDANREISPAALVDSAMGCAGQRCMALSMMLSVGDTEIIIEKMIEYAKSIKTGTEMGAVINKAGVERITNYIDQAEEMGATILVDGRNNLVEGLEGGYWIGPTIIDHVTENMPCGCDEIFGPVLSIRRVKTIEEAIWIENANPYGNAASVFTSSGESAKYVAKHASAGMIGVNVGVPVPREPFSFGGWNQSKFGVGDITGQGGINFWTQEKKVTVKWLPKHSANWMG